MIIGKQTNFKSWDASLLLKQRRIQGYYLEWKSTGVSMGKYVEILKTSQLICFFCSKAWIFLWKRIS